MCTTIPFRTLIRVDKVDLVWRDYASFDEPGARLALTRYLAECSVLLTDGHGVGIHPEFWSDIVGPNVSHIRLDYPGNF
jgi:hypothetical protein